MHQALKGESAAVRAEARKRLVGVLGMTGLLAGAMGMPLLSVVLGVLDAVAAAFGDDDEPWDAKTELRDFLADFGLAGAVLDRGLANALTGADVSTRVSLNELWLRDPDRDLDAKGLYAHYLEQALGPVVGIGAQLFRAMDLAQDGHLERATETALPKAVRDGLRAVRYAAEGVSTLKGDPIVPREALTEWDLVLQANGFTPDRVRRQWDQNRQAKRYEGRVQDRRQALTGAYAMAALQQDPEGMREALRAIRAFNRAQPTYPIQMENLRQSMRQRLRLRREMDAGVHLDPRLRHLGEGARVAG
jgi:hypothetical protein